MSFEPAIPAIRARGLGRRYGRHWALARIDLEVAAGEAVLLAGANGSGKTTLLRLLAGVERPTRGDVQILGDDPHRAPQAARRHLSMVSHASYLYPGLSALETARVWARLLGHSATDDVLVPLLEAVDLAERRDVPVGGFSAGMKKRLAFVRIRLERPRLVLLDEPFSALDAAGKRMVEDWLAGFRADGIAVVMASHALERAGRACDRAVLLTRGQLAWQGPATEAAARLDATR